MQGKVSMIVPCYNKKDYIGAMLQSVENQVWDSIELILVNDGSTDGTREIIAEWKPRLIARGYEVVIIDQENQGVCAAVYNGMLRMTGDYFCLVDADDEIMPEYCSRMAGWLDEHDDYEWAACHFKQVFIDGDTRVTKYPLVALSPETPRMLENWLLWRTTAMTWIYMMRVSYVKKCGLIKYFCTERRPTYEPCIVIPPSAGGGRLKFFDEPLYVYNKFASDLSDFPVFEKVLKYYGDYLYLIEWVFNRLDLPAKEKERYIFIARLMFKFRIVGYMHVPGNEKYHSSLANDISGMLDEIFAPPPKISADDILRIGFRPLFEAVQAVVLDLNQIPLEKLRNARRIIGYGALGKRGEKDLPDLISLSITPTLLWDNAADDGAVMCGIPVTRPDFESLSREDAVVVFPSGVEALAAIRPLLDASNAGAVLYREDMRWVYSRAKFPSLEVLT